VQRENGDDENLDHFRNMSLAPGAVNE
jgi:hypothetical protein